MELKKMGENIQNANGKQKQEKKKTNEQKQRGGQMNLFSLSFVAFQLFAYLVSNHLHSN